MKQVLIEKYGPPWEVARCAEVADVGAPAADEVVFDVLAFPINPADMWFCKGSYRLKPPLPATPGAECVGRVTAVGAAVKHVEAGDLVINLQPENWAQRPQVKGVEAIGGSATGRLADCIATDGTLVHYGSMSGEDPRVGRSNFIYRGVRLTGFMLGRFLGRRSPEKIREIYGGLAQQVMAGKLSAPVDTVYPIDKIK